MKSLDPDKSFIVNYAPIFAQLSNAQKELIMQKSKVAEYKKGDIIYKQFDPADAFYCIITGRVRVFNPSGNKRDTLEYLNCGKYFGVISLLTGDPHSLSAEAVNDSRVLIISKDDFHIILEVIPKLAIDLSRTLSRRLKKGDAQGKRVFESHILSVFSAASGIGCTVYASNLAFSLKKETHKNVIRISLNKGEEDSPAGGSNLLNASFLTDSDIKEAIIKDEPSGISILDIRHNSTNGIYAASLNALLTFLTGDYHYIVVDLPPLMDATILGILNQSDMIHIITDCEADNLAKTKELISDLFENFKYHQDRIKVILNAKGRYRDLSRRELFDVLGYNIYATLPEFSQQEVGSREKISRLVLEVPEGEYAKSVKRVSRELGDVRVGLALSGGAAFGLAHIGVLKILERENITIDMVTGSSIGALVGALWAVGIKADELEKIILEYDNNKKKVFYLLMDICLPKLSFARGRRIRHFLERYLGNKTFYDIKFPLKIIACNLNKRQGLVYDSGPLIDAVMASIAIPGVFEPTKINGDLIIDGGIIEPVPISALIRAGIKKIIAVNVFPSPEDIAKNYEFNLRRMEEEKKEVRKKGPFARITNKLGMRLQKIFFPNILDVIVNSIQTMEYVIAENDSQRSDVVLRPIVAGVDWFEFFKVEALLKRGEEEALKSLAAIKNLINE